MRTLVYTNQIKKDFKRAQKKNKDLSKLKSMARPLLRQPRTGILFGSGYN